MKELIETTSRITLEGSNCSLLNRLLHGFCWWCGGGDDGVRTTCVFQILSGSEIRRKKAFTCATTALVDLNHHHGLMMTVQSVPIIGWIVYGSKCGMCATMMRPLRWLAAGPMAPIPKEGIVIVDRMKTNKRQNPAVRLQPVVSGANNSGPFLRTYLVWWRFSRFDCCA